MISVIIPYNKDRGWLGQCIDSVKNQTYKDFEIIEAHGPGTLPENFNNGLRQAKGEFIKLIAEDDWLPIDSLQHLIDGIGDAKWVVGNVWQETNPRWVHKPPSLELEVLLKTYDLHGGSTLFRRDILDEIGGMDETLETGEEYDMHLKLLSLGHNPAYIDKEVYHYRMWAYNKSKMYRRERKEWRQAQLDKIKARYDKRNRTI